MDRITGGIPGRVAGRLAEYVLLGLDPDTATVSATSWEISNGHFAAAWAAAQQLVADTPAVLALLHRLREQPSSSESFRQLRDALDDLLSADRKRSADIGAWLDARDDEIELGYHVGSRHTDRATPVSLELLLGHLEPPADPMAGHGVFPDRDELLIVTPFRDDEGSQRLRNLLACLLSLRDQSLEPSRYAITVVEADTDPRRKAQIMPLADHYIHAPGRRRLFNT